MKVNSRIILLFSILVGFFVSCEKVTLIPEEIDTEEPIYFGQDIVPIFENKCVSCHNGNRAPDLRAENVFESLTTGGYINLTEPEMSKILETLYGTHDARATEAEKTKILAWITQGAKND